MSSTVLFLALFCGLTLAQDGANEREVTVQTQSCSPDMCKFLVEFGAMKEKLNAVETKLLETETKMKETETKLQQTETKLHQTDTKLLTTKIQVVELKNKGSTTIAFSTVLGGPPEAYGPFNSDTTLIYKRVILNIGDAYNQSTGVFTAPVAGVYYFSFFYHAGGRVPSSLSLFKNSELMVKSHDHATKTDTADNGGNAVFLQLQQGDRVFVQLEANSHVFGYIQHTTFSGFLVSKT